VKESALQPSDKQAILVDSCHNDNGEAAAMSYPFADRPAFGSGRTLVAGQRAVNVLQRPIIVSFDHEPFDVTNGSGDQVIHQTLKLKVDRATLQEDPDPGNADELKANIRIHAPETPVEFTEDKFTDQEVLLG